MTSQGSPYARLRRAIAQRSVAVAMATAAELPRVSLADALALCLLVLDKEPGRYESAAVRWHSRFCREVRPSLGDAQLVLAALHALREPSRAATAESLAALLRAYEAFDLVAPIAQWSGEDLG